MEKEVKNNTVGPHAEAKEWFEKGGQLQFRNRKPNGSYYDNWHLAESVVFTEYYDFRPYTHGLEKGMEVPKHVLNAWNEKGIVTHKVVENSIIDGFELDDENHNVYFTVKPYAGLFHAEGFLDFWKSFRPEVKAEQPEQVGWPLNTWLFGDFHGHKFIFKAIKYEGNRYFISEIFGDVPEECIAESVYVDFIKRTATKSDIESIFKPVLEKKGYKEGVIVKDMYYSDKLYTLTAESLFYESKIGIIVLGGILVYYNGKFAEIISQTVEQPQATTVQLSQDRVQGDIPLSEETQAKIDKMFNPFTQDDLDYLLSCTNFNLEREGKQAIGSNLKRKIQCMIQPEPAAPVEGDIYEYEGMLIGYCLKVNEWNAIFDCDYSSQISIAKNIVPKKDWSKLVKLNREEKN